MYDLFVSYSSADRGWAEVLETKLHPALAVYRDKTRLTAALPFQQQLFSALEASSALLIIWSSHVRDMQQGQCKEWVITEREHFRARHPEAPIVYLLLDDQIPEVDAHVHKLDHIRGQGSPDNVSEATWDQLIHKIKDISLLYRVEVDCYVLACSAQEFASLKGDPNLGAVLESLSIDFDHVAKWYGPTREEWCPAGGQSVRAMLGHLEEMCTAVLKEDGVPEIPQKQTGAHQQRFVGALGGFGCGSEQGDRSACEIGFLLDLRRSTISLSFQSPESRKPYRRMYGEKHAA